jgi:isoleucyl-tRNA synthetase
VKCPESVHLCNYPEVDGSLIDADLSADMDALLRLVRLGAAARSTAKIKVRQPLAELVIVAASDREQRAGERFNDQLRDELNVKRVVVEAPGGPPRLTTVVKPNYKVFGRKFGAAGKSVEAAIAATDAARLAQLLAETGTYDLMQPDGTTATLAAEDVTIDFAAPQGFVGLAERGTQILLDVRVTPELAAEGLAREAVRHIQELRKTAGLEMDDRIELYLDTDAPQLRDALTAHREYIDAETLTVRRSPTPLPGAHSTTAKLDGQPLTIGLQKSP